MGSTETNISVHSMTGMAFWEEGSCMYCDATSFCVCNLIRSKVIDQDFRTKIDLWIVHENTKCSHPTEVGLREEQNPCKS